MWKSTAHFLIVLSVMLYISCASDRAVESHAARELTPAAPRASITPSVELDSLTAFFKNRESDLNRARNVVIEKQIVKNLTHLQSMDGGGRKYYLLEREAITSLIRSVTKGIYEDCIIVNRKGKIIYTMTDNDIFGKNVRTQLKNTPYERCYINHDKPVYIDDPSNMPKGSNDYYMFFSNTSRSTDGFSGVVILQVNIDEINKLIPDSAVIINPDGKCMVSRDRGMINKDYRNFSFIAAGAAKESGKVYSFRNSTGIYSYKFFDYANLSWIVIALK